MKKLFLIAILTAYAGMAQAQQAVVPAPDNTAPVVLNDNQASVPTVFEQFLPASERVISNRVARKPNNLQKTRVVGDLFEIGRMANTYAMIGENRQQIACDPKTGAVAVIYRGNDRSANGDGNTLYIRYSTDHGLTWGSQGDNIATSSSPRYPIVFLNPNDGNPPHTSVLWPQVIQYGDGTSGFGAIYAMRSDLHNANPSYSTMSTPPAWSIPWQITPDQTTGHLYSIALALEPTNGASTGELFLLRSTDNGANWQVWPDLGTPVYTSDIVPPGYFSSNLRLDISPDGSTMIQAFALIIESEPGRAFLLDENHEVAWRVSTDQGRNWGALQRMRPSDIPVQDRPRPFDAKLTMAWDFDVVLDYQNRPHFLTVLSADTNPFDPFAERPTDTTVNLVHVDSTFTCEVTQVDGKWTIYPIGPVRRVRTDRASFTAGSTTDSPYVLRNEPKWARNYEGTQIFAKWISPYYTWRIGIVAGQATLFSDTLTQIYVNGRHVDSKSLRAWRFGWDFATPVANTYADDSLMRVTELEEVGAKFTKMAYYAGDNGQLHIIFTEWGIGETYDDDPLFSDQTVWYVRGQGVELGSIGVGVEEVSSLPGDFELRQNFPNPFNPTTEILFTLPNDDHAVLRVFDVLGRNVATLSDQLLSAGTHRVTFDASNLPSGVYMYRLESGSFSATKKMLLNK